MVKDRGRTLGASGRALLLLLVLLAFAATPAAADFADDFYGSATSDGVGSGNSTSYQLVYVSATPPQACQADGSEQCPFPTLGEAVDLAHNSTCLVGNHSGACFAATVIVIAPGSYDVSELYIVGQQISFLGDQVRLNTSSFSAFFFESAGSIFVAGFVCDTDSMNQFVGAQQTNVTLANILTLTPDLSLLEAVECEEVVIFNTTMRVGGTRPMGVFTECGYITFEGLTVQPNNSGGSFQISNGHVRLVDLVVQTGVLEFPLFDINDGRALFVSRATIIDVGGSPVIMLGVRTGISSTAVFTDCYCQGAGGRFQVSGASLTVMNNVTFFDASKYAVAINYGSVLLQDVTIEASLPSEQGGFAVFTADSIAIKNLSFTNCDFKASFNSVSNNITVEGLVVEGSSGRLALEGPSAFISDLHATTSSISILISADVVAMDYCSLAMNTPSHLSFPQSDNDQFVAITNCVFTAVTISSAPPLYTRDCIFEKAPVSVSRSGYFEHTLFLDPPREELAFSILAAAANVTLIDCQIIGGLDPDDRVSAPFISISNPLHIQNMPKLTIANCTFDGIYGSSIEARFSVVSVTNSTFQRIAAQYGSVLNCDACAASFTDVTIQHCRADTDGGAFYFTSAGAASLTNVKASNCSCVNGSGAFIDVGGATILNMTSCELVGGTALTAGAISMHGLSHLVAEDLFISDCCSLASGGAIVLIDYSIAEFVDSTITRCIARSYGGAASCGGYAELILDNVEVTENMTPMVGGALYFQDFSKLNLTHSLVASNNAGSNVGGIAFAVGSGGSISHTLFANNTAGSSGGAMGCFQNATATFTNVTMVNNQAESGGAVWTEDTAHLDGVAVQLVRNSALSVGGALLVSGGSTFGCTACCFTDNVSGGLGGAMFVDKVAAAHMQASNFTGNSGSSGGAVAILANSQSLFEDCNFADNSAVRKGGAFVASVAGTSSKVTLESCTITGNTAFSGGAMYATIATSVVISGGTVKGNSADCCGGAFVFEEHTVFSVDGVEIGNNTVKENGGAFFLTKMVEGVVENSSITDNRSEGGMGGGVFILESSVVFTSCDISRNTAGTGGGVLLQMSSPLLGSQTEFNACNFTENIASLLGGGIAVSGGPDVITSNSTGVSFVLAVPEVVTESLSDLYQQGLLDQGSYAELVRQQILDEEAAAEEEAAANPSDAWYAGEDPWYPAGQDDTQWTFKDCRIMANVAQVGGGGIYVGTQYLERFRFGPNRTVIHNNVAGEMGGGVFIQQGSHATWLFNGDFLNNTAMYGGYNVAWVRAEPNSTFFCHNCTYGTTFNATLGYNDARGFATLPAAVALQEGCPMVVAVTSDAFSVSASIVDAFGTEVLGEMLEAGSFHVLLDVTSVQNCMLQNGNSTIYSPVNDNSGLAYFDVSLVGSNGTNCSLSFSEEQFLIKSAGCSVFMEGCQDDGEQVVQGLPYDTCEPVETDTTPGSHVTGSLILALVGLVLMLVVAVIGWVMWILQRRKKARLKAYYANLEIPDRDLDRISLAELLEDPKIPVIRWEDLEILERIGTGASGIVSHGIWQRPMTAEELGGVGQGDIQHAPVVMDVDVAVKELLMPVDELNSHTLKEFIYEIQLMSALKHPSIVEFLGVAYDGDRTRLFLVTELMDNGSLTEVLHKKGKNLTDVVRTKMAKDAAKGMVYLHSQNIIHRDLKTANLLVNGSWQCKISDFGISTVKNRTMTMTCIGTPLYMAPEVLQNSRYSEKADVYSFGIVLVELYTNRSAYAEHKGNDAQLLYRIVAEQLRPRLDELPGAIQELVADCLTEDPAMRPSFAEILTRLKRMYRRL